MAEVAPYRIDAGSSVDVTDVNGHVWKADGTYLTGPGATATTASPVAGDEGLTPIYQTQRTGTFSYAVPLPAGTYLVRLRFVDPSATVPAQVTGVAAAPGNGQLTVTWATPADGGSPLLDYTVDVVPSASVPAQVTGVTVSPGSTTLTVTWATPADGGSPLLDYTVDVT